MLNQKANKASHPAIEQLQKNLRQASDPSQEGGEQGIQPTDQQLQEQLQQQLSQSASSQQQQIPSESPGIPGIDAQLTLNEKGELCQVGGSGNDTDALAKAQKKKVIRQQQKRLVLLRHASKCRVGPTCSIKFCPQMVVLWKHMKRCRDKSCKTAHCLSSRCVLNHYRICKGENRTETCEVCSPVMKQFRVQAAANGDEVDQSMEDLAREAQTISSVGINASAFGGISPALSSNITSSDVQRLNDQQQTSQHQLSGALDQSQQQQAPMQSQQDGRQSTSSGGDTQQMAEIQAAQQKLQQQQLLLQQLQQQQAQLLDQQKQLQQQQQQVLPQTQQGQQLQQQQTLLQKLQQEFQQQQQLLQHELQRQSLILQQGQRGQVDSMSIDGPSDGNKRKRASDAEGGKRLSKMAKELSAAAMRQKRSAGTMADGQPQLQRSRLEEAEEDDGKPRQKTTEGTIDTVTSLIPSMTRDAIIEHLDSLQGGLCLTPRRVGQRCLPIIRKLINDPCGWVFRDPVDPVELGLPDYFDVVKKPMHLALIEEKLDSGVYKDMDDFEKDVRLVFDNAILYNGEKSDVGEMANDMLKSFEREYAVLQKAIKTEEQIQKRKGDSCALCGSQRRLFEPTVLYCNGACGMQRIRRNAFYYTDPSKQNHWCTPCYGLLKDAEPVALDDGSEVSKSSLQKYKNDALPEEAWVQCDDCHEWVHQICALSTVGGIRPRPPTPVPVATPRRRTRPATAKRRRRTRKKSKSSKAPRIFRNVPCPRLWRKVWRRLSPKSMRRRPPSWRSVSTRSIRSTESASELSRIWKGSIWFATR